MRRLGSAVVILTIVGLSGCCTIAKWTSGKSCDAPAPADNFGNAANSETTRGLRVGARAPDVTLGTAQGEEVALSDVYGKGPVVLAFYRGGWCPFCVGELEGWQSRLGDLEALGGVLVAITPESPEQADQTAAEHDLSFAVLSDVHGQAAQAFDLGFELDAETQKKYRGYGIDLSQTNARHNWELVIPATYVIDEKGVIRYAYVNEDYKKRADPDEVLAAVRSLR